MKVRWISLVSKLMMIYIFLSYTLSKSVTNTFSDLIYNLSVTIDNWDAAQVMLGYYTKLDLSKPTYLDLKELSQLIAPTGLQIIGVLFVVYFLAVPLSFQTLLNTRLKNKKEFIWFYLRETLIRLCLYCLTVLFAVGTVLTTLKITSQTSTFHYQSGHIYRWLILYGIQLFFMILAMSLVIFRGYLKNKGVQTVSFVIIFMTILTLVDRAFLEINIVLFDIKNGLLDSLMIWIVLSSMAYVALLKTTFKQEEYND